MIYDFTVETISGVEKKLSDYKGKVMLIVNTASKCGFTPQYKELQKLYDQFKDQGFEILGFPCNQFSSQEPGANEEILNFCEMNYGVTFPLFAKLDVKGRNAHPLFEYLTKEVPGLFTRNIKWNFTKFLVNRNGKVYNRYPPIFKPKNIKTDIVKII
jgi:glutathione peroxidase